MATTMNGRHITTEEAKLKTASVEIKAITVSGKQMTLAVFRQLIEEPIVDEVNNQLLGVPWGIVNYHSGVGCEYVAEEHLHIIWQKGSELRRSCTVRSASAYVRSLFRVLNATVTAYYARFTLDTHFCPSSADLAVATAEGVLKVSVGDETASVNLSVFNGIWFRDHGVMLSEAVRRIQLEKWLHEHKYDYEDSEQIFNDAEIVAASLTSCKRKYASLYQSLQQLDQLFIAV